MTLTIRPYQSSDFDAVYGLWQAALGESWPITADFFKRYVEAGERMVAEQDGQVVGFVMAQVNAARQEGTISLVMVRPENQRQGIGTKLQAAAVERLRQQGVVEIQLGHGPFWPGVPIEPPGAVEFFKACGWVFQDTNYDLAQDLIAYQTPPGILERVAEQGIEFRLASQADVVAVLELEDRVFPYWAEFFHQTADAGQYTNILAAWDGERACLDAPGCAWAWHAMPLQMRFQRVIAKEISDTHSQLPQIAFADLVCAAYQIGYVVFNGKIMSAEGVGKAGCK